jgi:hypothetical protein
MDIPFLKTNSFGTKILLAFKLFLILLHMTFSIILAKEVIIEIGL